MRKKKYIHYIVIGIMENGKYEKYQRYVESNLEQPTIKQLAEILDQKSVAKDQNWIVESVCTFINSTFGDNK